MSDEDLKQALIDAVYQTSEGHVSVYVLVDGAVHNLPTDVLVSMTVLEPGEYEQIQANINEGADNGNNDDQAG